MPLSMTHVGRYYLDYTIERGPVDAGFRENNGRSTQSTFGGPGSRSYVRMWKDAFLQFVWWTRFAIRVNSHMAARTPLTRTYGRVLFFDAFIHSSLNDSLTDHNYERPIID
jgi:hypothetical protein